MIACSLTFWQRKLISIKSNARLRFGLDLDVRVKMRQAFAVENRLSKTQ